MSWVTDVEQAKELILQAGTCKWIDNRRVATSLQCMSFCDVATFTRDFGILVSSLMQLSADTVCNYVVLDPHPENFFFHQFNKYPVIELRSKEILEQYTAYFNQSPSSNSHDALGTLCYEWVIIPQSHHWFVHCLRDSEQSSGHLWLPAEWIEQAQNMYSGLTYLAELEPNSDDTWPG
jgi:hypothetical protein